ncbi:MAG: methyl-accepting chemotaxis protein [Geobacteraceae bacterium]
MKNLKLGHKLIGVFMVMALFVALIGTVATISMKRVGDRMQDMLLNLAGQQKLALLMEVTQKDCHISLLQAAMVRTEGEKFEEYAEDYRMKRDQFRNQCEILLDGNKKIGIRPAVKGSEIEERVKTAQERWDEFDKLAGEMLTHKEKLLKGGKDAINDPRLQQLAGGTLNDSSEEANTAVDDLLVSVGTLITQANKEIAAIQRSAGIAIIAVVIVSFMVAILFGFLINWLISKRLAEMVYILEQSAEGDLTLRATAAVSNDELGKLTSGFHGMLEELSKMVCKIMRSSEELTGISNKLTEASQSVVTAAQTQADAVNNTSSAMTQINASIKAVGERVDNLSSSAAESSSSILEMAATIEEVALHVETLAHSVEEVSSSIMEIMVSIKQVGNGVVSLMDVATTTASSIMEMDSSIKQVGENARGTAAISEEVRKDAETGKASVEATIAGINEIRRSFQITSKVIGAVSTKADEIGVILSVIDEVAEQTNLLALNAAIIAAQAGEHGKGFAVVADEIKELAERTRNSTREIGVVINGTQEVVRHAVEVIGQAEKSITDGEQLSHRSGEALSKIVDGVKQSTVQMSEIARATVEQSKGSQMIRNAMEQVSEMVGQIAKATREQGEGSEIIMSAVERMKELTTQVRNSTREQSNVGGLIANSTENITGMIEQIKRACDEQKRGSEQVVIAVEDIQLSTNTNLDATQVMNESVANLFRQIEILRKEMSVFKV